MENPVYAKKGNKVYVFVLVQNALELVRIQSLRGIVNSSENEDLAERKQQQCSRAERATS